MSEAKKVEEVVKAVIRGIREIAKNFKSSAETADVGEVIREMLRSREVNEEDIADYIYSLKSVRVPKKNRVRKTPTKVKKIVVPNFAKKYVGVDLGGSQNLIPNAAKGVLVDSYNVAFWYIFYKFTGIELLKYISAIAALGGAYNIGNTVIDFFRVKNLTIYRDWGNIRFKFDRVELTEYYTYLMVKNYERVIDVTQAIDHESKFAEANPGEQNFLGLLGDILKRTTRISRGNYLYNSTESQQVEVAKIEGPSSS